MGQFIYKKHFGQHFLKRFPKNFLWTNNQVFNLANKHNIKDIVLIEIGPGAGAVTDRLISLAQKLQEKGLNVFVYLIEIDNDLIPILKEKYQNYSNVRIYNSNVLDVNLVDLLKEQFSADSGFILGIIGSLPYNLSKKIIKWSIKQSAILLDYFKDIYFLDYRFIIQKEVAQDYVSLPPHADFLGTFLRMFTKDNPQILAYLKQKDFSPPPKVESAVLSFLLDPNKLKNYQDLKIVAEHIRAFFNYKKKTLGKITKRVEDLNQYKSVVEQLGIGKKRPVQLDLKEWFELFKKD